MPDNLDDVNIGEDPSTLPGGDDTSEGVKTPQGDKAPTPPKEEKTVPYNRFQEVVQENQRLKSEKEGKQTQEKDLTLDAILVGKKLDKYSEDVIKSIASTIKSNNPQDILAALENPLIKQGIEAQIEKEKRENKVPAPGSPGSGFNEKTPAEIAKMSREEHMAYEKELLEKGKVQGI